MAADYEESFSDSSQTQDAFNMQAQKSQDNFFKQAKSKDLAVKKAKQPNRMPASVEVEEEETKPEE